MSRLNSSRIGAYTGVLLIAIWLDVRTGSRPSVCMRSLIHNAVKNVCWEIAQGVLHQAGWRVIGVSIIGALLHSDQCELASELSLRFSPTVCQK